MNFRNLTAFSALFVLFVIVEARVNVLDITTKQVFDIAVTRNNRRPVIVFYTRPPCGLCGFIQNKLKDFARNNNNDVDVAIVDLAKRPELQDPLFVDSIPTTRAFYKGDIVDEVTGTNWVAVKKLAENVLNS